MKNERTDDSVGSADGKPIASDKTPADGPESLYKSVLNNITVVPVLIPYLVATTLVMLANQNLNLQKACRVKLNLSAAVCDGLENKQRDSAALADGEVSVQELVADMLIWQTVLQSGVPAVLVLFLASWSDRNRLRRPCMLLPVYGEMVRNVGQLVCVYFFKELSMEATGLVQALPAAVSGHWIVMFMAAFSYVGDVSTEKNKSMRVGLVNLTVALCLPIGTGMSGVLYRALGFKGVYFTSLILCFVSVWTAHVFVHDTKVIKLEQDKELKMSLGSRVMHFFSAKHIYDAFKVTFKREKNNRRMKIIVLTVLIAGVMGPVQGEKSVAYLFTRVKFNWNEVQFSVYSTTMLCVHLAGTLVVLGVVIRKYGVDDALLGAVASVGKFLSRLVFAFATNETIFYLGLFVNCMQGVAIISMKTIVNKIVPAEELGQVTAVTSIGETVVPVVCGPFYSYVYKQTVDSFPGAYFLVTAVVTFPTVFLYTWLYLQKKRETRGSYEDIDSGGKQDDRDASKSDRADATTYGTMRP